MALTPRVFTAARLFGRLWPASTATVAPPPRRYDPARDPRSPTIDPPGVYIFPIDGRSPRPENVAKVLRAIAGVPSRFRKAWQDGRGRMELIPGVDASRHPLFTSGIPAAGYNKGVLSVVAAESRDPPRTAIHEMGHALDSILGVSSRPDWLRLWQYARRKCGAKWWEQCEREFFAESFSYIWTGLSMYVSEDIQNYLAFRIL